MVDLTSLIEEELERFGIPGAGAVVVVDGDIALTRGFGHRDAERGLEVTTDTLFPIASTTKSFTAAVLAILVDDGVLEWDRPVRDYLPDFELMDPLVTQQMTVRDMLSHRTGLGRHEMAWMMAGHGEIPRGEFVKLLRHLPFSAGFRQQFGYNNLMYMTAGYLPEVVVGRTWEELVEERLLGPLGMTSTSFTLVDSTELDDRSVGHTERDGAIVEVPYRDEIIAVAPSGSINSSISDMGRWLSMNVNGGRHEGEQLISEGCLRELWTTAIPMPEESLPWPETRVVGYGMGWVVEYFHGRKMLWHNGGLDGVKSIVAVMPAEKLGVAVLTNRFPTMAPEAIAHAVVTQVLELSDISWGERLREIEIQAEAAATQAESETIQVDGAPPSHPLEEYAGTYTNAGYGRIAFEVVDDELRADLPGLDATFAHRHYDVWKAKERVHGIELPFAFLVDFEGKIDRLEARLDEELPPVVFVKERTGPVD